VEGESVESNDQCDTAIAVVDVLVESSPIDEDRRLPSCFRQTVCSLDFDCIAMLEYRLDAAIQEVQCRGQRFDISPRPAVLHSGA
jgi:hypothetical protein